MAGGSVLLGGRLDHLFECDTYVWNVGSLSWVPATQSGGGGGGTVDQGTGGSSPWLVTGPATDAQLRATPLPVSIASAIDGLDYHVVSAGSNNAATVKAGAGTVYGVKGFNKAAYPVYVKLYDKASNPNPAADAVIRTVAMQAGVRCEDVIPNGLAFLTGIAIAIVKGISDTDNTAVVAADACVDVDYA